MLFPRRLHGAPGFHLQPHKRSDLEFQEMHEVSRVAGVAVQATGDPDGGDAFRVAIPQRWCDEATFVPIPPSKAKGDSLYDDRLVKMLDAVRPSGPLDVRELLFQTRSTRAAHTSGRRLRPDELEALYRIDESLIRPEPRAIAIVDDMITHGAHFRAAEKVLTARLPSVEIGGCSLREESGKGRQKRLRLGFFPVQPRLLRPDQLLVAEPLPVHPPDQDGDLVAGVVRAAVVPPPELRQVAREVLEADMGFGVRNGSCCWLDPVAATKLRMVAKSRMRE